MEKLYTVSKNKTGKFRLKWEKMKKNTKPFRYDINQIPYDYTVDQIRSDQLLSRVRLFATP